MTDTLTMPEDDEWVSELGAIVEAGDEPWQRTVRVAATDIHEIHLWLNAIERTVTIRWIVSGQTVVDIYRESATEVTIATQTGVTWFSVNSRNAGCRSSLRVQVHPTVAIRDELLLT